MKKLFYSTEITESIIDVLSKGFCDDPSVRRILKFNLFANTLGKMDLEHLFPALLIEYIGNTNFWHNANLSVLVTLYNFKLTYIYPSDNMEVEDEVTFANQVCEKIASLLFSDICGINFEPSEIEQGGLINEVDIQHIAGARSGGANAAFGGTNLNIATLDLTVHFNTYSDYS